MPRRIVLVGDLQQGSRLDALGDFEWPSDVELDLKTVADPAPNAGLHAGQRVDRGHRRRDRQGAAGPGLQRPGLAPRGVPARLARRQGGRGRPAGRRLRPARREPGRQGPPGRPACSTLRLKGDAARRSTTPSTSPTEAKDEATVLYVGDDAPDDAEGLLYYLGRVFEDTPRRAVKVVAKKPTEPLAIDSPRSTPLVVLAGETDAENAGRLRKYAEAGGTVLFVIAAPGPSPTLAALADAARRSSSREAPPGRDAMLGEIAFDHPLFAPLAGAQFNDFTKIRFWKHRRIDPRPLGEARVLARFEGGDPAVVEKPIGKGRLVVLASGWNPVDSQLARSSKFVPLMAALLEGRTPPPVELASLTVGDRVPLPGRGPGHDPQARRLDRRRRGRRGLVRRDRPAGRLRDRVAARLAVVRGQPRPGREQDRARWPSRPWSSSAAGWRAGPAKEALDREHLRQLQNAELEGRQKLWRALILAAIGVLIVETWLAGRLKRPRAPPRRPWRHEHRTASRAGTGRRPLTGGSASGAAWPSAGSPSP